MNCGPGYYSRKSSCVPCELGQYQDRQGQTSCKRCPPGRSTDSIGATSVEECVPGVCLFVLYGGGVLELCE